MAENENTASRVNLQILFEKAHFSLTKTRPEDAKKDIEEIARKNLKAANSNSNFNIYTSVALSILDLELKGDQSDLSYLKSDLVEAFGFLANENSAENDVDGKIDELNKKLTEDLAESDDKVAVLSEFTKSVTLAQEKPDINKALKRMMGGEAAAIGKGLNKYSSESVKFDQGAAKEAFGNITNIINDEGDSASKIAAIKEDALKVADTTLQLYAVMSCKILDSDIEDDVKDAELQILNEQFAFLGKDIEQYEEKAVTNGYLILLNKKQSFDDDGEPKNLENFEKDLEVRFSDPKDNESVMDEAIDAALEADIEKNGKDQNKDQKKKISEDDVKNNELPDLARKVGKFVIIAAIAGSPLGPVVALLAFLAIKDIGKGVDKEKAKKEKDEAFMNKLVDHYHKECEKGLKEVEEVTEPETNIGKAANEVSEEVNAELEADKESLEAIGSALEEQEVPTLERLAANNEAVTDVDAESIIPEIMTSVEEEVPTLESLAANSVADQVVTDVTEEVVENLLSDALAKVVSDLDCPEEGISSEKTGSTGSDVNDARDKDTSIVK